MKKFKFRLEGLKKLRNFREHQTKIEMGVINKEIEEVKSAIAKCHVDLDESYDSFQAVSKAGAIGRELHFYPLFNQGKRAEIDKLESELRALQLRLERKMEELHERRGESKVIENMREREESDFKKELTKKEEIERQDLFTITRSKK